MSLATPPRAASSLAGFHPAVANWFAETLGEPTEPQRRGWPLIVDRQHVLVAAPTGTGKTLAAFLSALDGLLRQGAALPSATQVLYVSPLRALSNDVQRNLQGPLAALAALDPSLPEVRVLVRTGDTPQAARAAMGRKPPHILVTTPESLFILLTSDGGRALLSTVRTVIVDEIHALARDKRGSHLALSLERLQALVEARAPDGAAEGATPPRLQRIGLSATQKPLEAMARLLGGCAPDGAPRPVALVDVGHLRALDLDAVVPDTPLAAVCSHDQWGELYGQLATLVRAHRTTLIFVNTRKLAERLAARLTEQLGAEVVGCHHGSLSRETREQAERRLKLGQLRVLVATASLELGIDIGDVDLAVQVGSSRSIATLLQRVGRAGHGVGRVPKGRLVPLTLDEGVEAVALLDAIRAGELDRTPQPPAALDILLQQLVAACVPEAWEEEALFQRLRSAAPYAALTREDFDACVALHSTGRYALLHRDGVGGLLRATKRARLPALTSGGAIPDNADYRVLLEPEGTFVGTLNEDFAIEANVRDIFQLGNTSWRILRIEPGVVRVADAAGEPPTLPFWLGEAPSRTSELSARIGLLRQGCAEAMGLGGPGEPKADIAAGVAFLAERTRVVGGAEVSPAFLQQIAEYLAAGAQALGTVPTQNRLVLERFFDESGGMQLVVHSPFGGRINRAFGLALRKRFCRGFGFELQAAANEEAIVLSLGSQHSFPLEDVWRYLNSATARDLLVQALLAAPMFTTRWRWNAMRSLLLPRLRDGRPVPPALQRMRAEDLLAAAFPQAIACGETLPPGDLPVPMEHPLVRQTVEDCLHEALDVEGLLALLAGLESGAIERRALDRSEPSPFAFGILTAQPYSFLDDAPLEERRTQAVRTRRVLDPQQQDELGALDPEAIARVRAEAWPDPVSAVELHEALQWMGFLTTAEARRSGWEDWLTQLAQQGRAVPDAGGQRWFAAEAPRAGREVLRGRLEALGPVAADDPLLAEFAVEAAELEVEGAVLRTRLDGRPAWCMRRLLARIHRATLDRLRAEIEPVSAADFLRFLARWQHVAPAQHLEGPRGVMEVVRQLAGFEAPAAVWESSLLPARVQGYRPAWLDELALSGELSWGRLWGAGTGPIRGTPIALFPREDLGVWCALAAPGDVWSLRGVARQVHEQLAARGACFAQELQRATGLLPAQLEQALSELVGLGLANCDAFAGLRRLFGRPVARSRGGGPPAAAGRWSLFRQAVVSAEPWPAAGATGHADASDSEAAGLFAARVLLRRTGVVFRRTFERERLPVPWRDILRALRRLESRGELRGGRFVAGFSGEQFALPEAVEALRQSRRERIATDAGAQQSESSGDAERVPLSVLAADPLNFIGLLTPDERVASTAQRRVIVA
ncbi:MAG: DEAD/DEAH box helicase [Planctomycetota bacterium]